MQVAQLPEVGKTYRSKLDPTFIFLVTEFDPSEIDNGHETGFYVQGCAPEDADDMTAMGYDFTEEDWIFHGFTQLP